jgi:hypothetical protein
VLPQAFQFYFVFSDYFSWPQRLVVRLLLLAGPMAVWMILLAVTLSAFRRVMSILRCVHERGQHSAGNTEMRSSAAAQHQTV